MTQCSDHVICTLVTRSWSRVPELPVLLLLRDFGLLFLWSRNDKAGKIDIVLRLRLVRIENVRLHAHFPLLFIFLTEIQLQYYAETRVSGAPIILFPLQSVLPVANVCLKKEQKKELSFNYLLKQDNKSLILHLFLQLLLLICLARSGNTKKNKVEEVTAVAASAPFHNSSVWFRVVLLNWGVEFSDAGQWVSVVFAGRASARLAGSVRSRRGD